MKLSILLSIIVLLPLSLISDEGNYPGHGSSALLFEINQISLSNFKGGIGAKFFHADTRFVRVGFTGSFIHRNYDREQSQDMTENSFSTGIRLGKFFHRDLRHNILGYTGLEITGDYTRFKFERDNDGAFPREEIRQTLRGGIGPAFGIEYFLTDNISLAGEYALRLTASRITEDTTSNNLTVTDRTTQYLVGIHTGGIYLSIYF